MAHFVLVHGAWHGSWCWDEVSASLVDKGHEVEAIDLPGHDRPGDTSRKWNTIGSYVDAVAKVVDDCPEPPILVGHSMGGYTVQRYLETGSARMGVLVASVPHTGTLGANLRVMRRHPRATLLALGLSDYFRLVDSMDRARDLFFTADTPEDTVRRTFDHLQGESALAMSAMVLRRIKTDRVSTPIHVIAGERDQIITVDEQRSLAAAYESSLEVLDCGHDLMLDTCWPALAASLHGLADT